jgi:hypothetical protein
MNLTNVIDEIQQASAELKADNDAAEVKAFRRDFWQEGLQQEYNDQMAFESLIQH